MYQGMEVRLDRIPLELVGHKVFHIHVWVIGLCSHALGK